MRNILASILLIAAGGLAAADGPTPPVAEAPKPVPAAKPPALTLADLPEVVRATLERQADGSAIEKIKAEERNGEQVFSARWTKDGVRSEVRLGKDGRLLKLKAERKGKDAVVTLDRLPEVVRAVIDGRLADGKVVKLEQEDKKGKMIYKVEITRAADRLDLEISAEGTVLDEEVKPLDEKKDKDKEKKEKVEKQDGEKPAAEAPAGTPAVETAPAPAN